MRAFHACADDDFMARAWESRDLRAAPTFTFTRREEARAPHFSSAFSAPAFPRSHAARRLIAASHGWIRARLRTAAAFARIYHWLPEHYRFMRAYYIVPMRASRRASENEMLDFA